MSEDLEYYVAGTTTVSKKYTPFGLLLPFASFMEMAILPFDTAAFTF
jgi:hypothetical protein